MTKAIDHSSQLSAVQCKFEAQRIAFGPMLFYAVDALRSFGILARLWENDAQGLSTPELASQLGVSTYGIQVLCEAALRAGVLSVDEAQRLRLTKIGYYLLHDSMTQVNFDFVRDVCYAAMPALAASIERGTPEGLPALGGSSTVYECLLDLPTRTQQSWLNFDHFYSDQAFSQALPHVLARSPRTLMDVGANTGRFAEHCLRADSGLRLTLIDHAPQLALALRALTEQGFADRVAGKALDLRDLTKGVASLPGPVDVVWLSQVIDCFSAEDAIAVLRAARSALSPDGRLFILEPCLDRQTHPAGAFCLAHTSLYFACVANGTSRIYDAETVSDLLRSAGLELEARHDGLGLAHSLFQAAPLERSAA